MNVATLHQTKASQFSSPCQFDRRSQGGVWDYVSASRLNLWLKCPLAFKFRYVDGIRSPTTPSLFIGKQSHAALELYYRNLQLGNELSADDIAGEIDRNWDTAAADEHATFPTHDAATAAKQKTIDLVSAYLVHSANQTLKPLAVETSLECPLIDPATGEDLGIPLLGIVDLIHKQDDGPIICDFKTASRSSAPVNVMHEIQLSCYSYLFRQSSGRKESALEIRSLIKTKSPKFEIHSFAARSDEHFRRLFAILRAYLDDLSRNRFLHRPGFGCTLCDFENSCSNLSGKN